MAEPTICSVPKCGKPAAKRGMCGKHYLRVWRHGDPNITLRADHGAGERWLREVAFVHTGNECLLWPFAARPDGYAVTQFEGRALRVNRIVCQHRHGPAPDPSFGALHSCGNGHLGCCAQAHLRWGTQTENMLDRVIHGTSNRGEAHGMHKLTEGVVREVRALRGVVSQRIVAARYGLSPAHVSEIQTRKTWSWLE